jgi:hypothetical protein
MRSRQVLMNSFRFRHYNENTTETHGVHYQKMIMLKAIIVRDFQPLDLRISRSSRQESQLIIILQTRDTLPTYLSSFDLSTEVENFAVSLIPLSQKITLHIYYIRLLKGTVARDFLPLLFSFKRTFLGP